jgi:hypothetical protein
MPITGFAITGVEGRIDSADVLAKQRFPKLNINIEKVKQDGSDKVKVDFVFMADYADSDAKSAKTIGTIKMLGTIDIRDEKGAIDTLMKKWNDSKMLPTAIAEEIINGLNFRCSATGTLVAYSLGLIPPLVISTTRVQEGDKK